MIESNEEKIMVHTITCDMCKNVQIKTTEPDEYPDVFARSKGWLVVRPSPLLEPCWFACKGCTVEIKEALDWRTPLSR